VRELLNNKIVDRPIFPFRHLFKIYPLLVSVYADLPYHKKVRDWIKTDKHVFATFRVREGDYNTMIFEFHKSVEDYMNWRRRLVEEDRIPDREQRIPSTPYYFSNALIQKYEPNAPIQLIHNEIKEKGEFKVYNLTLDKLSIEILTCLINGVGIKVNESLLSGEVDVHRATIKKRINLMLKKQIIFPPICRFPHFFVPPGYILVVSMVEIKSSSKMLEKEILKDPHITLAYRISQGRYNLLLFEAHRSVEDYLSWETNYENKYPNCFGSIKNNYLSPKMAVLIDQQKVSLGALEDQFKRYR
jgi:hypothetical protein